MPDVATHLALFGLGSYCGYLLFRHDQRARSVPFYEENLIAMVGAMLGGGILFNLPYFILGAEVGAPK
jgi:formate/nitrite transporter FocA (FNT family)